MISLIDIMDSLNNHFLKSYERKICEIVADGIVGAFSETYIAGMYIIIEKSYLNDGIYKVASVTSNKITVEETLVAENTGKYITIFGSTPPKAFVDLSAEINNYSESVGASSESIDDYSVSFADGDGSWESAYSTKLNKYRSLYDDRLDFAAYYTRK